MIQLDDVVWVVGTVGSVAYQRPLRLIGKGVVKGIFAAEDSDLPPLCTVHLTEMYESTSNSRIAQLDLVFKTREGAEQCLFLHQLKDER